MQKHEKLKLQNSCSFRFTVNNNNMIPVGPVLFYPTEPLTSEVQKLLWRKTVSFSGVRKLLFFISDHFKVKLCLSV